MTGIKSFLQELDDAVARGSPERRLRALWYATDLLITGRYSEDDIWVFGEVIGCLVKEIEAAARAELAKQLARTDNAPFDIINRLAFDSAIDIAGPILRHSARLDVNALVANASTKSQQHLLAISKRRVIPEAVTDVLVTRGNREVVKSVATNEGARFSNTGFLHLVMRSERDSILAVVVGQRLDIPRHLFQQLIAKASDDVKRKLQSERPESAVEVGLSVATVAGALQAKFGPASKNYFEAKKVVGALHRYGNLSESNIREYAQSRKLEETTVGLSLLCSLPVDIVERALVDQNREMVLMLAKASDFCWETTMSVLFLGAANHQISAADFERLRDDFVLLNVETAQSVLQIFQSRKSAAIACSEQRRLPQLHAR